MSDPTDLQTIGTHTGVGALGAALVAALSRFVTGKESQAVATELALLRNDVTALKASLDKNDGVREEVALLKRDVQAIHERLDGKRSKR